MRGHPTLDPLTFFGVKMGLERMRELLALLGDPHLRYPVIHVAGTNGKGSVCRMLGSVLESAGKRVGVTTSPHLQHINERIRIGSRPISDDDLNGAIAKVDAARAALSGPNTGITWFEFSIAAAFVHFAEMGVEIAVVEVGMGGRLDATNVVKPVVTAIVSVGLDHVDHLGPDHASIASEKAGIIKPGVPVVVGPLPREAFVVVRALARDRVAPTYEWGAHFSGGSDNRLRTHLRDFDTVTLGLLGEHQTVNAAVACQILELLPDGLRPSEHALRVGLGLARNEGRLEWVGPNLLIDGAHNADGASALARYLQTLPHTRPRTLVLGGGSDKDIRAVAAALAPQVDRILTTSGSHGKARTPWQVANELEGLALRVHPAGPLAEALALAGNGDDLVIVAGSLYLIGELRDLLGLPC